MFRNLHLSSILFNASIIIVMIVGSFFQPASVQAKNYDAKTSKDKEGNEGISPAGYLNPNGTLNLDGNFSGSFDLQGWDVQMDPVHGPVFQPANAPLALGIGQWANLGGGIPASPNSNVRAIAISGTDVYVGGSFTDLNNTDTLDFIAKWNGTSWSALGSNGAGDGSINSIVDKILINGADIYVAGSFINVNNNGTILNAADYIAKWNGTNWSALGSNGAGNGSINDQINALAISGSTIYVGGHFTNVNNNGVILTAADYVARWNGTNWSALGSNGAANGSLTNAQVYAIAIIDSHVYVGGQFTNVNNNGAVLNAADYVAKWDGTNWSALSSNGSGDGSLNSYVRAMAVSGSNVYIGGQFTNVSNNGTVLGAADHIVKWDGTNWSALGSNGSGNGSLGSQVLGITVSGTDVYVGGIFGNVNSNGTMLGAADYIAKWDGTKWSALGSNGAGDGSLNYYLGAIAVSGSNVYIGGLFSNVNNNGTITGLSYLALFNGTNWGAVGTTLQGALRSYVSTVAVNGTDVYVGGGFTNANNIPEADYVAKWDGTNWSALGSNGSGDGALSNSYVTDIAVNGSNVYVGGTFGNVIDNGTVLTAADNVAKWDGTHWSALGSNGAGDGSINSNVHTLTVIGSDVYVGGVFENVNNNGTVLEAADYIAKWDGSNWSALGSNGAGDGSLSFWVDGIAVDGSDVYVIGVFTNVNNNGAVLGAADYIAKWDGTNWSALSSNGAGDGSINGYISAIAISGSDVYVGGNFVWVNDNGTFVPSSGYIAKWDGTKWSGLGSDGAGGSSLNGHVNAIAISGNDIYAGGQFANINNHGVVLTAADYIAKWDGSNWSALGSNAAANGAIPTSGSTQVRALGVGSGSLYVGGSFFNVNNNGTPLPYADYIAAYGIPVTEAIIDVIIGGAPQGSYTLPLGTTQRVNYAGLDSGPVKVVSTNAVPIIAALRDAWAVNGTTTSFSQLMGLPAGQVSDKYVFPAYNNVTLNEQLRIGNVNDTDVPSTVTVTIGGVLRGTYTLEQNEAIRINYDGLDSGPVVVDGTDGVDIIAAIREAWAVDGVTRSFVQLMGLPASQLSDKYVFPAYNNVTLNEQLRIGNVDTVPTTVTVTIGGVPRGTYDLDPDEAIRINYAGLDSGPVIVDGTDNVDIIAAIRDAWAVDGVTTSYSQLMGLPAGQLSDQYFFPAYNNVTLNEQLRIGNVDDVPSTVTVTIGGVLQGSYDLDPDEAVRINYAGLDSGPVVIYGTNGVDIIAAIRDAWAVNGVTQSFVQLMGLPYGQMSSTYLFPAYNNVTLNEQLRFGVP